MKKDSTNEQLSTEENKFELKWNEESQDGGVCLSTELKNEMKTDHV